MYLKQLEFLRKNGMGCIILADGCCRATVVIEMTVPINVWGRVKSLLIACRQACFKRRKHTTENLSM